MLSILIKYLALLSIVTLILPCLFSSLHIHGFIVVYHLPWWVDSLACILSWSSFEHVVFVTIHLDCHSLYVDMNGIYVLCLTVCCMTTLLLYDSITFVHVGHTSISLPPTLSFRSFPSFWFLYLQVWGLMCAYFSYRASWLGVGSSDGLYRCLGSFWRRWTYWHWLESDVWWPV